MKLNIKNKKADVNYKIIGFRPNFNRAGESAVKIKVGRSAKSFCCLIKNIYKTEWIEYLSEEDCTYLASIANKQNKPETVQLFPLKYESILV